jgi:PAS domain S-box-containing protein
MGFKDFLSGRQVLDCVGLGVFTVDTDWNITFFSKEAERITGWSQSDAVGRKCWEVFYTEFCNSSCHLQEAIRSGRSQVKRLVHFLDNANRRIPLEITASVLLGAAGEVIGGVECFSDRIAPGGPDTPSRGPGPFADILGNDPGMLRLFATVASVAPTDAGVLLLGETGTGKDLFARALHAMSPRKARPFVKLNCAALPDKLLESELFGYKAGAFTDARKDKPGLFELAEGGTIFLDEIGDLPPDLQAKLLQVLEDRSFYALGATTPTAVNVRVLSATNHDLAAMAAAGRFRPDLYYRLRVVDLRIPPLRERPGDILLLLDHFLAAAAGRYRRTAQAFSPAARRLLAAAPYPGNVRELKHVVEQAVLLCTGDTVQVEHLPPYLAEARRDPAPEDPAGGSLADRERRLLLEALAENGWSVSRTAGRLGINRSTLWRRMRKYGI